MSKYGIVIEIFGRKYRCEVEGENLRCAEKAALDLFTSKMHIVESKLIVETPIKDITDDSFERLFGQIFRGR